VTDPERYTRDTMQRAIEDLTIPVPVAQLFVRVAEDLLDQANLSKELAKTVLRQGDAITRLGKEIDRLKGVHGA